MKLTKTAARGDYVLKTLDPASPEPRLAPVSMPEFKAKWNSAPLLDRARLEQAPAELAALPPKAMGAFASYLARNRDYDMATAPFSGLSYGQGAKGLAGGRNLLASSLRMHRIFQRPLADGLNLASRLKL